VDVGLSGSTAVSEVSVVIRLDETANELGMRDEIVPRSLRDLLGVYVSEPNPLSLELILDHPSR